MSIHTPILGGTHKPTDFDNYKDSCLQASTKKDEGIVEDVVITVEIPVVDNGFATEVTIRCHWEDLLDYHDHQNQLGIRTTVEQRVETTKDFFSKIYTWSKFFHKYGHS